MHSGVFRSAPQPNRGASPRKTWTRTPGGVDGTQPPWRRLADATHQNGEK